MNKFDALWDMSKAFLRMYPDAEFGDPHVVLSDGNYYTEFIEGAIDRLVDPAVPSEGRWDVSEWKDPTVAFLRFLLTIPEEQRLPPDEQAD